jgi:hypothetical protein
MSIQPIYFLHIIPRTPYSLSSIILLHILNLDELQHFLHYFVEKCWKFQQICFVEQEQSVWKKIEIIL